MTIKPLALASFVFFAAALLAIGAFAFLDDRPLLGGLSAFVSMGAGLAWLSLRRQRLERKREEHPILYELLMFLWPW